MNSFLIMAASILAAMFYAATLHSHWAWFVAPLGAPPIDLAHAYGLVLLIKLSVTRIDLPTKPEITGVTLIVGNALFCALMLGMGKIVHLCM